MRAANEDSPSAPEVTLRIPGVWTDADQFFTNLPRGCRPTEAGIVLADGSEFELHVLPADDEFPRIFADSCPKLPTEDERDRIENYTVNVCVTGRGGSIDAAKRLMRAGAAVMAAGGAGVFIDNCGLAHGATDWHTLLDSADDGGVYWAFVATVRGEVELYSIGMQVLGLRDAIVPSTGDEEFDHRTLHSFLGYTAFSGATLKDGDMIGDVVLPSFRVFAQPDDRMSADEPMFNAWGRWRLVRFDGERN